MFDLFLRFTGLCGFVPATPDKVVLTDSRNFSHNGMPMPHLAAIVIPLVNLQDTPRRDGFFVDNDGHFEDHLMVAYTLDSEELSLNIPGTSKTPTGLNSYSPPCPTPQNMNRLEWVVAMNDFVAGTMTTAAYSGPLGTGLVLARFNLPASSQPYTDSHAMLNDQSLIVKWSFPPANAAPRALAEVVTVHRQISAANVTIQSSLSSARNFTIAPGADGQAAVWVVNMMHDDIVKDNTSHTPTRDPDVHLSELFRLAKGGPTAVTPTPFPPHCSLLGTGQAFVPKCPPALFTAVG
jgi:hypothetical protein